MFRTLRARFSSPIAALSVLTIVWLSSDLPSTSSGLASTHVLISPVSSVPNSLSLPPSTAIPSQLSFNVIITTAGRSSLPKMLASIAPQLRPNDFLTLISDTAHEASAAALAAAPCACTRRHIANEKPLGFWGHGSRSRWQDELPGDFCEFTLD